MSKNQGCLPPERSLRQAARSDEQVAAYTRRYPFGFLDTADRESPEHVWPAHDQHVVDVPADVGTSARMPGVLLFASEGPVVTEHSRGPWYAADCGAE